VSTPEGNATGRIRRLLLVEDNLLVAKALEEMLRDAGYVVDTAETGEAAWSQLQQLAFRYDAVLCDVSLPGMSGRELLLKIRQANETLPVFMTSGYCTAEDSAEFRRSGASGLLPKPFSQHELLAALRFIEK
jgi:DNA-binding response OmpR family regulator